jgi:predicted DCC family thiol-disulfide oxidoreductase YuxK
LTVYFDGACPVCSREIAHYQRQPGAQACTWIDVAGCAPEALGPGLAREQALARLHVRLPDGRLLVGADGFAALWQALPGWRWLGRLAASAPVRPLAALAYDAFLLLRRLWRPTGPRPVRSP